MDDVIEYDAFLGTVWFDGWRGGFLLARALGERLGTGAEFVCGPSRADWWNEDVLIAEPVAEGTAARLREWHGPLSDRGGRRDVGLDNWSRPLPEDLATALGRVELDLEDDSRPFTPTCRGVAVIELDGDGRTLRVVEVRG